jgi:diguanylate cyclase (GGDEF)-like protein/hemerythrin-like metal-binding protein/PAS domain S-box-containing protein
MNSIDIFPWNEGFNTGVSLIDDQHRQLIRLLNLLASHVAYKTDIPALNSIFKELADYAIYHFKTEEAIWHEYFPEDSLETNHKEIHNNFISTVTSLKNNENSEPINIVIENLLSFLTNWLASHILETDRFMALTVIALQSGLSMESAKIQASDRMSGTMRTLIDIVLSTYGNHVTNTLYLMREIKDHQKAENDLIQALTEQKESATRVQSLMDSALDAVVGMDENGKVIAWNPQAEVIFGYSREASMGKDVADLIVPPMHREAHRRGMVRFISTNEPSIIGRRIEIIGMRSDGTEFPVELTISGLLQNNKHIFNAYIRDITDRKKHEEAIYDLAFYDPLTHLPNRRLMLDRLEQKLRSSDRMNLSSAIFFISINDFKILNTTQGHNAADSLLIEVAKRLQSNLYKNDTVASLGGGEFAVLLDLLNKEIDLAATLTTRVAEKLLTAIGLPLKLQDNDYHCSASIGITLFNNNAIAADELLKHADAAMQQAEQHGRNSINFYDPDTQAALEARAKLETLLRKAIPDELQLYYQMQVDRTGLINCAEVLVRWIHPKNGIISPADFIPLAEETGLILPIGLWVLETACKQLKDWEQVDNARHLSLAVNVSAKQFHQPDFVDQVIKIIKGTNVDPSKLKLELTESLLINNVEDIIFKMTSLGAKGVKFSLDDFGTGFSSLSYLKRLPLNQLKIDQSFVRDALNDPNDAAIVRTIIALGQSMGLDVIAEGVESEDQRNFLEIHGCNNFQGYLFSKPVPLHEFEALLEIIT